MGKKRSRTSRTSNGVHGTTKSVGKAQGIDRLMNQLTAHLKGKNVVLTVPSKDKRNSLINVNSNDYWGVVA